MTGWRQAGDAALLIDAAAPAALAEAVRAAGLAGVADALPGARTVLVITEPGSWDLAGLAEVIGALPQLEGSGGNNAPIVLPVVYDGQDLADVAGLTGLPVAEVIARHAAAEYTVGWLGFAPGFGYLTGLDPLLRPVPRLATPRISVPAGSVAIAGGLAAVYPAQSPGGWRLLGRPSARLWDPARDPPSLLVPDQRVRFRPADPGQSPTPLSNPTNPEGPNFLSSPIVHKDPAVSAGSAWLEVLRPGPLATVQDLGRHGLGSLGVPPSGAADTASLTLANLLVGNPPGAAGLELTMGRAAFRCAGAARLAVTGAPAPVRLAATAGEPPAEIAFGMAFEAADGAVVTIGAPPAGLRSYLAVAGGIDVPPVLGSRSCDLHSGLGGGPLQPGEILPVGSVRSGGAHHAAAPWPVTAGWPPAASGPRPAGQVPTASGPRPAGAAPARAGQPPALPAAGQTPALPAAGQTARLRIVPGPRLDWFAPRALDVLLGGRYQVSMASNRTGLRLDGPALPRAADRELDSEGMVTGSIQVPHDGRPILLLADHPTVGGYPVIAVVASAGIGLAAQLRPGQLVSFTLSR